MDGASSDMDTDKQLTTDKIGPGIVVLIVGPSGAGKDALLHGVAEQLSGTTSFHFATRTINRPSHEAERNDVLTLDDPAAIAQSGAYALYWQAHGLIYAISADIDDHVRAGRCVVFNASRTIVAAARHRYANVKIVYINAPRKVRTHRLALRGRETAEEIETRLAREVETFPASAADHLINNEQSLEAGVNELRTVLSALECATSGFR